MRNFALLPLTLVVPFLTGCISPSQEKANALAIATTRCEKQGKQVHVVDVSQHGVANVTRFDTTIDFECVGPGDAGYVPPPKQ
jgi:hypothetical protein